MTKIDFNSEERITVIPVKQLAAMIEHAVASALAQRDAAEKGAKRLTTQEAARHLGCSTYYLQELHKQGLPYEKGRPNFYRLADLEAFAAKRRLQLGKL